MSSTAFCAEIYPEKRLRQVVLATGMVVVVAGATAILLATVPVGVKWLAGSAWALISGLEMALRRRGWRRCDRIRFLGNGEIAVRDGSGDWANARLLDGSVLLRHFGWLRLKTCDGTTIHELVRGHCRQDRDWRRLHVIWRHI